jgi:Ca-activated chloride channel family protein
MSARQDLAVPARVPGPRSGWHACRRRAKAPRAGEPQAGPGGASRGGTPFLSRAAATLTLIGALAAATPGAAREDPRTAFPLSVRITSPLGRTGLPGVIRIVAQVAHAPTVALTSVRFYVNGSLHGEDAVGPPYFVEWSDENPFDPTTISVEVTDVLGNSARDEIQLEPFEVVETTQISSVLLEAAVIDDDGRYVTDLGHEAFRLLENEVPQSIDLVRAEALPATFTLLVDSSQSMQRRMPFVRDAAARLVPYLRPLDKVVVVPFTRQIGAVTGPTDDRATVMDAIAGINAQGGTAILDSLITVSDVLGQVAGRHVVVLVTDGYDEHSVSAYEAALRAVQSLQATVYVIGIGGVAGISLKGERFLRKLAAESGGRAFFPSREEELPGVHELVAQDAQLRYLITYTPLDQSPDGTWRRITLTTRDPAHTVRVRPGYFARTPPPVRPSIEFTVTDASNQYVPVDREQVEVKEEGVVQTIETFQEVVGPVAVVLALDASGSMKPAVDAAKDAARSFVEALRPQDSLAVLQFADRAAFVHDLTTNRQLALAAVESLTTRGGTALYDALAEGSVRLQREEARRVIIVLTDGRDEDNPGTGPGSEHTLDQVLDKVRTTGTTVFGIGLGPRVDRAPLERLAEATGGRAYFPTDASELPAQYARVLEDLRRRYLISYASTNARRDGSWRPVEITLRGLAARVTSQAGYFAPAQ